MVRFWDTSALIALVVAERATARAERWLREDSDVADWTLTRVELLSALARRRREQHPSAHHLLAARREILSASHPCSEVTAVDVQRRYAERAVVPHPIKVGCRP